MSEQSKAIETFRTLHESGCFVLPNPWDAGSAIYLEHVGFKALATTSAGFAFSKGLPDGPAYVSREMMLDHYREIAAATELPVNADFQNGYADEPEGVVIAPTLEHLGEVGLDPPRRPGFAPVEEHEPRAFFDRN